MKFIDTLIGKSIEVGTDMKVVVTLEIKSIEIISEERETWEGDTYYENVYTLHFTNGSSKKYRNILNLEIL